MKSIILGAATIAGLSLGGFALAQEDSATSAAKTSEDAAFPVAQSPVGEAYIRESFEDWNIRCINTGQIEECSLYQLLKDDTGNPTAEINLVPLSEASEARAGVTFITPLGTLLTQGVSYSIDSDRPRRYPFTWCDRGGCVARYGFTDEEVGFMKQGKIGEFTIVAIANPQNPLKLTLSLKGFSASWDALKALAE